MFCKNCGMEFHGEDSACPNCGGAVTSKNNKRFSSVKPIYLISALAIITAIVVICILISSSQTNKMRKALENNDYESVQSEYMNPDNDSSKIDKFDSLIAKKIKSMSDNIDGYNFKEYAQTDSSALETWLLQYGSLMQTRSSKDNYISTDFPLNNCISYSNQLIWDELCKKISSAQKYCYGVYNYAQSEYSDAIKYLIQVSQNSSCYEDSQTLIDNSVDSYVQKVLQNADKQIADGNIDAATELLNNLNKSLENKVKSEDYKNIIDKKSSEAKAKYAESYSKKAEESFNNKDVYSAISNIEFALELSPDNSNYKSLKSKYEEYLPFELYKGDNILKKDTSAYFYNTKTANNNEEFENVICYNSAVTSESYKFTYTYKLNKNYDTLSGTIFLPSNDKDTKNKSYFIIIADGKKIYTSPYITSGVFPQKLNINISNVNILEIQAYCIHDSFEWFKSDIFISNLIAKKSFN